MSTIAGNNITLTASQIVGSTSNLIIRTPTAISNDTLDTATNIIFAMYALNDATFNNDSFDIRIYNNSTFTITLNPGTGVTMFPTSTDVILPQTIRDYIFVKTSGTTLDMYLSSSGTAFDEPGIVLSNGNILVGNVSNIATDVPVSGDINIANTGATSIVATSNSTLTTLSSLSSIGTITTGVWNGTLISPTFGGTGVNNATRTLTLAGNLATVGAFNSTFTMTGATGVTFPTTGTLATTSQLPTPSALTRVDDTNITLTLGGTPATALLQATSITAGWTGQLSLTRGGTNASLTASNGGIFYSTATAGAILAGTATAGQIIRSGASSAPSWSTATYPASTTINRLLYSTATNVIGDLPTANSAILVTSSTGVPTYSSTMTNGQIIIGSTGATPVAASLTAGSGISITPGAGTITISSTGSASLAQFRAFGPSATVTPGAFPTAYTTITTYNAPTFDAGTYSYAAGIVTILVTGIYEVCYTVQFNSNGSLGSAVGNFQSRIIQNGSAVNGSVTEANMQRLASTTNRTFNSKSFILSATASDTLAIQFAELNTNTRFQLTQNQSIFTIKRLQ